MNLSDYRVAARGAAWVALLSLAAGCGGPADGISLSGTVTFDGQMAPAGNLILTAGQRIEGRPTQVSSKIVDGQFSVDADWLRAGPYWVEVMAFAGQADENGKVRVDYNKQLFPNLRCSVDLPPGDHSLELRPIKEDGEYRLDAKLVD